MPWTAPVFASRASCAPARDGKLRRILHMRQLSGLDYSFLQLDRGNNFMHVAGLGIYDPSTAPSGKVRFKDILRFFSARIEHVPHFRRRLVTVPWELDRDRKSGSAGMPRPISYA